MSLLKSINTIPKTKQQKLQESFDVISTNTFNMIVENYSVLCESAISFLTDLNSKVKNSHRLNLEDPQLRDMFGILAALELLRYPQARKIIDSNDIRSFMHIIIDVEGSSDLNSTEIKLLDGLHMMLNHDGTSGVDMRDHYLHMAIDNPKLLSQIISKLQAQYIQLMSKLHHSISQYSTHSSTEVDKVVGIA